MTYQELLQFCKLVTVEGEPPDRLGKLRQDSRAVEPDDIFIAIKGSRSDGHHFIDEALDRGASLIIAEAGSKIDIEGDTSVIRVKNTRKLIGPLAQKMAGNPAERMTTIGITGTNGKTTVATLVWQLLTRLGCKASLLGTVEKRILTDSYPSRLTTADPIELAEDMKQMVDAGSEYLVMEVSSHALDQKRVRGIPFDVGIFTNLSQDHLDYHHSMNEYASAKKKLFNSLDRSSWAITNADDKRGIWMTNSTPAKVLSFGFGENGLMKAELISQDATGMRIALDSKEFKTPLVGRFNAYNAIEALLVPTVLGLDTEKAAKEIEYCTGAPGRLERVNKNDVPGLEPNVFVDYAHTPDALENVLVTLRELSKSGGKLTVVFGCGGDRDKGKRPKMARVAESIADRVVVTSDNPRSEDPEAIIEDILQGFQNPERAVVNPDRKEAIEEAVKSAEPGSIILIAGKGHETTQEIKGKKLHFDDREVAAEAISRPTKTKTGPGGA